MIKMNDNLVFSKKLSVGFLDISTMELSRKENINKDHLLFERIKPPFDFYYHDKILIIPDPIATARENWNKVVTVCNQKIACVGEFICFFHFDETEKVILVSSLTLPEYDHVKRGIEIR